MGISSSKLIGDTFVFVEVVVTQFYGQERVEKIDNPCGHMLAGLFRSGNRIN
jgi:hypothetical protein